ncbi:polysaccharide deacetylase family protein [Desulforamulus putei]|uniref:Peptidoglycan/xylan/chitin deacetylase, PgdA/CDA1 family n=1 Tax=Desulforamulus putei DSM 12395 TaxID=1121429 RepID=A0A1M4XBN9_9FIRM|nr:polysaccharide deacetylase family protein [Desulforamulus putei]SHE90830.1 Peptidoglycan/xylan/chitin deacetylase, PgdA/CDA1 family [Desulforamulus putei DSM 12395]
MFFSVTKKILLGSFITVLFCLTVIGPTGLKVALGSKAIYRKETDDKIVALTFDDGPDPRYTVPILDTLKKYQAPATFFMVGNNVKAYPEIARKIVAEGHEVGNHTMTHPRLTDVTPEEAFVEIESAYQTIIDVTGAVPVYFRSPKGLTTDYVEKTAASLGMKEILWTVTIENRSATTPEEMADRVLKKVKPGYIILLHDGRLDRMKTVEALPLLLNGLKEKGYTVVPLAQLLKWDHKEDMVSYDPMD